ncbi:hypothetical protein GE061_006299 [Apolygus lucorum]|uniref:Uncharacterized protein n=1 Tax=Apolygus lucorum TaxID=248454 RepID=A0A6A4ISL7_APOLU|nr:hypothetical protein GE061_006299 [Apolygus lucorum]
MNIHAVLGIALLCLSQVCGEQENLLHSLFNGKLNELRSEKLTQPEIFLADVTTDSQCNANEVMVNGTTLMKNTLDIIQETFSVVYTAVFASSSTTDCSYFGNTIFGKFRCSLLVFSNVKADISDVSGKVMDYKARSADLVTGIRYYINHCIGKK